MGLHTTLRFPATNYAISTLLLYYTLSIGLEDLIRLYVYTKCTTHFASLSRVVDYSSPAALQNCNDMMFYLEKFWRQKTFGSFVLNCDMY